MSLAIFPNSFIKDLRSTMMRFLCFRAPGNVARAWKWKLKFLLLCMCAAEGVYGQVRYSVPEEMVKGSVVGNIAEDLGLDVKRLKSGQARVFTEGSREYIGLNTDKGTLVVKERIDREEMCGQVSPCTLHLQIILDNPMELHRIDIEILDINDNAPVFPNKEIRLKIGELSVSGAVFSLESAVDPDVGLNSIQTYTLKPSDNFILKLHSHSDGRKYLEMVLRTTVDREKQNEHHLILTAIDGGSPQKSGTVSIVVDVLDANDNAPIFTSRLYEASIPENASKGSVVIRVTATDADKGTNGEVSYSFSHTTDSVSDLLEIDSYTGDIKVNSTFDYEIRKQYTVSVQATDQGGLTDTSNILIDILDVNDNAPIITLMSFSNPIPEDSAPATSIAMLNIKDIDSGKNGQIRCYISPHFPFRVMSPSSNIFTLVTDQFLDREEVSEYNITITAMDEGSPSYSTDMILTLKISDVNDNAPEFEKQLYTAYAIENNSPGMSILSVKARDKDFDTNAHVSYFLDDAQSNGQLLSTYLSVNAESGWIKALQSFDFEQIKELHFRVKAQDGGPTPLSSNVTVKIIIQDQNDNAPQILYPVQTGGSLVAEMVPRLADVGYLVTKVVAVDVDSGQNAWLSYKLLKATDRELFEVGLQNGEIRTLRQISDKDAVKQRLTIVVEDNGQPSRSAAINVNVAVADSFPEVFSDFTQDRDYNDNLTFYLILALALISFLFISSLVIIISVKISRCRKSSLFYQSNLPVIPYYPPHYTDAGGTGTLPHVYNYEVCMTTDSRKSDVKYLRPCSQNVTNFDSCGTQSLQCVQKEKGGKDDSDGEVSHLE